MGGLAPNGDYSGAGFILGTSTADAGAITQFVSAICDASGDCAGVGHNTDGGLFTCSNLNCNCTEVCISDGGLPRCENVYQSCPSSSNPTTTSPSTTSTTTGAPSTTTGPASGCAVDVSHVARAGGSWIDNGVNNQIYDITVTNQGSCPITSVRLDISLGAGATMTSSWNFNSSYYLTNFGSTIYPGQSFNGAGFIVAGNGGVLVSDGSKACSECAV
eukprot:TRINITY_DN1958_c0_g1_i3.p1 TRINITY_DN1958_c0_g1~~TRINITY_DN1958_c0_g1_i3.p1  ORF type:complete len:217 (+),score=47.36 TRINITY_DN1958_c0_g1_i3:420-1070(+)